MPVPTLPQTNLGRTGKTIPRVGLGTTTFGREIDEDISRQVLDYAFAAGLDFIDTAEAYGGGNSRQGRRDSMGVDDVRETSDEMSAAERIIGTWLTDHELHDKVDICTKVSSGSSPENVATRARECLERLQTDRVLVYMVHSYDDTVPLDETMDALNQCVTSGQAQYIGCSNFTGAQLADAMAISQRQGYARFEIVENNYSLATPEAGTDSFPACAEHEITFMAYSPLGAGFLTGKYTPDRDNLPERTRFHVVPSHCDVYFSDRNFRVVEELRGRAAELRESMAYLAGAWVVGQSAVGCTLFGARSTAHVDNALRSLHEGISEELRAEMSGWD